MDNLILISALCVAAVGCVDGGGGLADLGGAGSEPAARIASNALTPSQLWNSNLDPGALTTTNLQAMAATADGAATLQYAITCALSDHQQVTVNNVTYQGKLDIAGTWTTSALSSAQQQWVSACILALVNLDGSIVSVSLRGGSIGMDSGEASSYTAEEGAFWGNMFLGASSYAFACNGVDQADDDSGTALALRECAEDDPGSPGTTPCGFTFAGLCTSACTSNNWYVGCNDGISSTTNYVVTTYLIP